MGWDTAGMPTTTGMDIQDILDGVRTGSVSALIVGGVDLRDLPDPKAARNALDAVDFLVSMEVRASDVTELADVVLPVAPPLEKNGTFINWEGRLRPFGQAISSRSLTDRDVLVRLAREFDVDLGGATLKDLYDEVNPVMDWSGERCVMDVATTTAPPVESVSEGQAVLATHKPMLDAGRLQDGAPQLAGTARRPVAFISQATLSALGMSQGDALTVSSERGSLTLPVEVTDLPDRVVWLPECSQGSLVHESLGTAGSVVTLSHAVEVTR